MYKIIFLDIDGTLTDSNKKITARTKNALLRAADKGIIICIASGRPEPGVRYSSQELELSRNGGYILPFNGAIVKKADTGEIVISDTLTMDAVREAYNISRSFGLNIITYKNGEIITECEPDKYIELESRINNMPVRRVISFLDEVDFEPVKCLITGEPEIAEKAEEAACEALEGKANVFRSEKFFVEVMPEGIDKARSIEKLITKLGIKREEVIACGDGFNDVSMIKYAGLGVAMCNGCEPAKAAADYITDNSNDNDGIAEVIEKFVL